MKNGKAVEDALGHVRIAGRTGFIPLDEWAIGQFRRESPWQGSVTAAARTLEGA